MVINLKLPKTQSLQIHSLPVSNLGQEKPPYSSKELLTKGRDIHIQTEPLDTEVAIISIDPRMHIQEEPNIFSTPSHNPCTLVLDQRSMVQSQDTLQPPHVQTPPKMQCTGDTTHASTTSVAGGNFWHSQRYTLLESYYSFWI